MDDLHCITMSVFWRLATLLALASRGVALQVGTELVQPKVIRIILPPKTPLQPGAVRQATEETSSAEGYGNFHTLKSGFQAGVLSLGSDAISQSMHGLTVDTAHCAAMATISFTLSGALNALWLRHLEEKIPGTEFPAVATKTACDFACCASIFNSAYLGLVPVLTAWYSGVPLAEAQTLWGWSVEGFQAAMLLEASTFSPYNL